MIEWTEEKLISAGYDIRNAKITSVDLETYSYGCLCLSMSLEGDGWGVVYGGIVLGKGGTYINPSDISASDMGLESIIRIMHVVNEDSFINMKGKYIRVATKGWGETVNIIGNILKDEWFDQESFFEDIRRMDGELATNSIDSYKDAKSDDKNI